MHDNEIEGMIRALRCVDQFLEDWPIFVECRGSRLREDLHNLDVLPLAPTAALSDLIGDRQIALGLPSG